MKAERCSDAVVAVVVVAAAAVLGFDYVVVDFVDLFL